MAVSEKIYLKILNTGLLSLKQNIIVEFYFESNVLVVYAYFQLYFPFDYRCKISTRNM